MVHFVDLSEFVRVMTFDECVVFFLYPLVLFYIMQQTSGVWSESPRFDAEKMTNTIPSPASMITVDVI